MRNASQAAAQGDVQCCNDIGRDLRFVRHVDTPRVTSPCTVTNGLNLLAGQSFEETGDMCEVHSRFAPSCTAPRTSWITGISSRRSDRTTARPMKPREPVTTTAPGVFGNPPWAAAQARAFIIASSA